MALLAQLVGIAAMVFHVLSYQGKTKKRILQFQFVASGLFTLHYLLLGAFTGAVLDSIGIVRAAVFARSRKKFLLPLFLGIFWAYYLVNCLVFLPGEAWYVYILELLPVLAMSASTLAFFMNDAAKMRSISLASSPLWMVYNAVNMSIGGTITEGFAILSIFIGMFRHDRKK